MTLGKTERLQAAGMAAAGLLRIILTERDREIAGPGWCVNAAGLGRSPASVGNRRCIVTDWHRLRLRCFRFWKCKNPAFNRWRSFLALRHLECGSLDLSQFCSTVLRSKRTLWGRGILEKRSTNDESFSNRYWLWSSSRAIGVDGRIFVACESLIPFFHDHDIRSLLKENDIAVASTRA